MAAARTCYAPRLIGPEEITDKQRVTVGSGTYYGGHHTVYQHAHFEFGLENVSRQFVWSFLHAHPLLQLRAAEPAICEARPRAGVRSRWKRALRSGGTRDLRKSHRALMGALP